MVKVYNNPYEFSITIFFMHSTIILKSTHIKLCTYIYIHSYIFTKLLTVAIYSFTIILHASYHPSLRLTNCYYVNWPVYFNEQQGKPKQAYI